MSDRLDHILTRLKEEGQQTLTFFRALEPAHWQAQVYQTGPAWDVRQVLCHFVSAERSLVRLFENIVGGGEGASPDFDIDRFNASQVAKMEALQPGELIAQFEATRAATVAFVEKLSDADLDRTGRHPFLGVERLEKMIKLVYRHAMLHQRDIQKALETGQPVPPSE